MFNVHAFYPSRFWVEKRGTKEAPGKYLCFFAESHGPGLKPWLRYPSACYLPSQPRTLTSLLYLHGGDFEKRGGPSTLFLWYFHLGTDSMEACLFAADCVCPGGPCVRRAVFLITGHQGHMGPPPPHDHAHTTTILLLLTSSTHHHHHHPHTTRIHPRIHPHLPSC